MQPLKPDSLQDRFLAGIRRNPNNAAILARWHRLQLPGAWLVAGCLFQTVWNIQAGDPPAQRIKDYDLFYFDDSDLGEAAEQRVQQAVQAEFRDLGVEIEVANQARVHVWYPAFFGAPYPALASAEEGIARFLVLETCVAVRPDAVHAPHGVAGVYAGTLTPNPAAAEPLLFERKVASYRSRWPALRTVQRAAGKAVRRGMIDPVTKETRG